MARRRAKKRTHVGARNGPHGSAVANTSASRAPKSMVIRIGAGEVGPSVSQLVKDVRDLMEPGTASRLKERRSNKLRDYTTMAGPLGVSHLLLFSRSSTGNTNLRLALTPRGPTLHFRVEKYSLCKDVRKAMKHPKGGRKSYLTAPLLVMNNFTTPTPTTENENSKASKPAIPKHLESLTTTIFQSLFPPISPQSTPLSSIRRVLLLNREIPPKSKVPSSSATQEPSPSDHEGSYILNLRHYAITTKRTGLSRPIRRLDAAQKMLKEHKGRSSIPNLGKLDDVADYLLDPTAGGASGGFTSGSESEVETDAEVEVLETDSRKVKVLNKRQLEALRSRRASAKDDPAQDENRSTHGRSSKVPGVEKRAVKLVELGPRMKLRMTKVEEGVCGGKVMWHEYLQKTPAEVKAMEQIWQVRRTQKEERRRVQKENVTRKREEKEKQGGGKKVGNAEEDDNDDADEVDGWDSEGFDDDEYIGDDGNDGKEEEDMAMNGVEVPTG